MREKPKSVTRKPQATILFLCQRFFFESRLMSGRKNRTSEVGKLWVLTGWRLTVGMHLVERGSTGEYFRIASQHKTTSINFS